jgi:hypothetical protein
MSYEEFGFVGEAKERAARFNQLMQEINAMIATMRLHSEKPFKDLRADAESYQAYISDGPPATPPGNVPSDKIAISVGSAFRTIDHPRLLEALRKRVKKVSLKKIEANLAKTDEINNALQVVRDDLKISLEDRGMIPVTDPDDI